MVGLYPYTENKRTLKYRFGGRFVYCFSGDFQHVFYRLRKNKPSFRQHFQYFLLYVVYLEKLKHSCILGGGKSYRLKMCRHSLTKINSYTCSDIFYLLAMKINSRVVG